MNHRNQRKHRCEALVDALFHSKERTFQLAEIAECEWRKCELTALENDGQHDFSPSMVCLIQPSTNPALVRRHSRMLRSQTPAPGSLRSSWPNSASRQHRNKGGDWPACPRTAR